MILILPHLTTLSDMYFITGPFYQVKPGDVWTLLRPGPGAAGHAGQAVEGGDGQAAQNSRGKENENSSGTGKETSDSHRTRRDTQDTSFKM